MRNFYEEALRGGYQRAESPPPGAQPAGASDIYLRDPRTGDGFWLTHGVTDRADGVTDADLDFGAGQRWGERPPPPDAAV